MSPFQSLEIYTSLVLIASFFALMLAISSWSGLRRETVRSFALLELSIAIWCFFTYLSFWTDSPSHQFLYLRLEFLGVIAVPLAGVVFSRGLARKPLKAWQVGLLAILPLASAAIVLSGAASTFFWDDPRLGVVIIWRARRGPWFFVHAAYSYLLLVASFAGILRRAFSARGFQRRFFLHIGVFLLIPMLANLYYVLLSTSESLDPTPIAFVASGLFTALGLRRYNIFDALPYAKDIAFSSLRIPLLTVDGEGTVVGSNLDAERLFSPGPALDGRRLSELCPEAATAVQTGIAVDWDFRGRNYLIVAHRPLKRRASWIGSIIAFEDVTNRVESMRAIEEREAALRRYEFMVNASLDNMTLVNREWRYEAVNDAFCERYGLKREDILGAKVSDLWDEKALEEIFRPGIEACFRGEYSVSRRTYDFGPPLGQRQLDVCFNPYRAPTGEVTHAVIVSKDVTDFLDAQRELKEAREVAEAANQAKSSFLAAMSHEIRTPLNAVIGLTELTLRGELQPEPRDNLETVLASGHRLLDLINDILDLSKIEAGRMTLERVDFDVQALLAETLRPFRLAVKEKGLNLYLAVEEGAPRYIAGDPLRLGQIVTNLVGNAVKFTDYGGITVTLSPAPDGARPSPLSGAIAETRVCGLKVSVRDTGIGIPPEKHALIFEGFSQADSSVTRRYGGTGLGLSICKTLAGLFGGEIGVESKVGEGSVFSFTAFFERGDPERVKPGSVERQLPEESPFGKPSLAVLLVEDSQVNAKVALRWLSQEGHRVTHAESGEAAIRALAVRGYDAVLMDIELGGMDGFETARRIRGGAAGTKYRSVPIIAMSAHSGAEFRAAVSAAGMDDYVGKPVEFFELSAALARVARAATRELSAAGLSALLPSERAASGSLIDETAPLKRLGGDQELYHEILGIFAEEAQERAASVAFALAQEDGEALRRAVHGIRGSAKTVGAEPLAAVAAALESGLGGGPGELSGAVLSQAETEALAAKLLEILNSSAERAREVLPPEYLITSLG